MSHANSRIVLGESSRRPIQVGSSCPFLKKRVWVVGGSEPELHGLVFSRPGWPCTLSSWSRLDGYATEPAVGLCSLLHDSCRVGTGADWLPHGLVVFYPLGPGGRPGQAVLGICAPSLPPQSQQPLPVLACACSNCHLENM